MKIENERYYHEVRQLLNRVDKGKLFNRFFDLKKIARPRAVNPNCLRRTPDVLELGPITDGARAAQRIAAVLAHELDRTVSDRHGWR